MNTLIFSQQIIKYNYKLFEILKILTLYIIYTSYYNTFLVRNYENRYFYSKLT